MIDFKELLIEEKSLGNRMAANYKAEAFRKIDSELQAITDDDAKMDLRDAAKAELETNEDSIVLNYIVGRISLMLSIRCVSTTSFFHSTKLGTGMS